MSIAASPEILSSPRPAPTPLARFSFTPQNDPATDLAFRLLVLFTFFLFSRILDFTFSGLRLPLILAAAILILAALNGTLFRAVQYPPSQYLLAFTAWFILVIPFSIWKGGSITVLNDQWSRSIMIFFMIASLATSVPRIRLLIFTLVTAILTATGTALALNSLDQEGRLRLPFGELGNSNAFGIQVVIGIILCTFIVGHPSLSRGKRILGFLCLPPFLWAVARTGSRTAMVMLAVALLIMFFRLSAPKKLGLVVGSLVLGALFITVLPDHLVRRYSTMFKSSDPVESSGDSSEAAAVASTDSRIESLRKSLIITMRNPFFGVGPGNFMVAEGEMAREEGRRPTWLQTHNGYTQVSSEMGIPALLLYLAAMFTSFRLLRQIVHLPGTTAEVAELRHLARFLRIALLAMSIATFFGVSLYQFYIPVLLALLVGTYQAATRLRLSRASPSAGA